MQSDKIKILIDIGHPAHVHYFKNFIKIMESNGCQFLITSRNKEIEHYLLKKYNIPFFDRGRGRNDLVGKAIYYFKAIYLIYLKAKKFTPDIIMSFGSPYAAIVSNLIGKAHIVFNDTEHAKLSHFLTDPFSKWILTPSCYNKNIGKKQVRFNGYMELCYLHPNYFTPDPSIFDTLGLRKDEKYIILRFVSWGASHDIGHRGLSLEMKKKAVKEFSNYAKVFISSEGELPEDLKPYQIKIPPERMHDVLAFASLYFGESPTMTTESALLGTPAMCVSSWACDCGNFKDLEKYNAIYCFKPENEEQAYRVAVGLIKDNNSKQIWLKKRQNILRDKIDVTAFMVWFVENYPESYKAMRKGKGPY